MRKLRKIVYSVVVVAAAVSVSFYIASVSKKGSGGDMGAFIEEKVLQDAPISGLEGFITDKLEEKKEEGIILPIPDAKALDIAFISDGKFAALDAGWKAGVKSLVTSETCARYDFPLMAATGTREEFLRVKAQMIVESACNEAARGGKGDTGFLQVRAVACKDVGVNGNLLDPYVNAECGTKYRASLCSRYRHCTETDKVVAYNRGPTGAARVADKSATEYARKVDFVLRALLAVEQGA